MAKVEELRDEPRALTIADLVAALQALKGDDDATLQKRAQYEAEAHRRLTRRENETHPGKSVFSHPEGDVARPKADLKCKVFWVGYPLEKDTLTPTEIDLVNQLQPGKFTFMRSDGTASELIVTAKTDPHGAIDQLDVMFPCRDVMRHNLPSMTTMLRQALGLVEDYDALRAELDRVKAELATQSRS